ncbi:Cas8a1 family CRISPR/Cas system-associated protein [Hydrogenobacter thermophilus]|uniref:Cas8a1 family CRISPR/Cas system-associated protein n=1 Tax=Hydrogenobacter thermophilus TaxID=940 RepID=UPI0030F8BC77
MIVNRGMLMPEIVLYPSSWLYNAGVIGFLRVLKEYGENVENFLQDDGSAKIAVNKLCELINQKIDIDNEGNIFKVPQLLLVYFHVNFKQIVDKKNIDKNADKSDVEKIKEVWGKLFNIYYRGFFNANTNMLYKDSKNSSALIKQFSDFVENMLTKSNSEAECSFCLTSNYNFSYKNKFTSEHNKILGASENKVPNSFWFLQENTSQNICDLCSYILLHHHLSLTKLQDGSEIFINAPSFKLMWNLNNYVRTLYGRKEITGTKEVLGISLIELSTKINIHLGRWEKMNIEVVSKYHDKIDFFSLPSDIVDLLTNREIASLLKQIGEFKILNMVLDGEFNGILEFGEKALRDAMKRKSGKDTGTDFINEDIKLKKNKEDLFSFSQKLFKLYALIKSELKKEVIA